MWGLCDPLHCFFPHPTQLWKEGVGTGDTVQEGLQNKEGAEARMFMSALLPGQRQPHTFQKWNSATTVEDGFERARLEAGVRFKGQWDCQGKGLSLHKAGRGYRSV